MDKITLELYRDALILLEGMRTAKPFSNQSFFSLGAGDDDHAPLNGDEDLEFRARLFSWMFWSLILVC
jgi:hypothetical protein